MKRFGLLLAAALATFALTPSAMADTTTIEETTVTTPATTTTTVTRETFALPAGPAYVVVDPLTGRTFGEYTVGVKLPAGYYVEEKGTGRLVATTDINGVLVAATDYATRRALIDQRIQDEYDAGRLTNRQVRDLRADLTKIANIELKVRKDGTLSSSNRRSIEKRFNELGADMSSDIAHTNKKRASLGIKVD